MAMRSPFLIALTTLDESVLHARARSSKSAHRDVIRARIVLAAADGEVLRLCRLRYAGSAQQWGFAIYRASHDDYEDSFLPTGFMGGSPEDALDTACGLYLADPTAWT